MNNDGIKEQAAAISFRQLRLFETVGRLSSVRRGSEECNLSQPAVTQALAKLEQQVGVTLLERSTNGSYLTDLGQIFHRRVVRCFAQMGQAVLELGVCNDLHAASTIVNRISRPQLRAFLGIIDHGTYLKAAQALDLTQTSLQRAARDFEAHLRTTVCFRSASGVLVSPEGAEIGRKLRLAAQEIEWGIREIGAARGAKNSTIVIGGLPFGGTVLLADVLDAFLQAHPSADVRIVTEGATEMLKRLRSGEVDLTVGIVQEVPGDDLRTERLAVTPYRIVCRPNHPLSATRDISLDQLAGYDWVVGAEGSSRRACFDALFAGHEKPRAPIATSSLPIIRHLLTDNDRLTLMTTYELGHDSAGLMSLPFAASHPAPSIGVTTRAGWLPTSMHDEFLTLLRASVTEWSSVSARRESVSTV